jgi:hypothetical protein
MVCKNTLTQFDEASRHLAPLMDFYESPGKDSPLAAPTSPGAKNLICVSNKVY